MTLGEQTDVDIYHPSPAPSPTPPMSHARFLSTLPIKTIDGKAMRSLTPEIYPRSDKNLAKYLSSKRETSHSGRTKSLPASVLLERTTSCNELRGERARSFSRSRNGIVTSVNVKTNKHLVPLTVNYRVAITGLENTGKSGVIRQFMNRDEWRRGNDGSEHEDQVCVLFDDQKTNMTFTETSDVIDENGALAMTSDAYVIVYSVTDRASFNHAVNILYTLKNSEDSKKVTVLVANKCDVVRQRKITAAESISVAKQYGCKHIETSVVIGHRIDELLLGIVQQLRLKSNFEVNIRKRKISAQRRNSIVKWFMNIARQKLLSDERIPLSACENFAL